MNIRERILQIKTILILLFLFTTTEIYSQPTDNREKIYMPHSYPLVIDTVKFSF